MGAIIDELDQRLIDFIGRQPFFTVATAAASGRISCSPKGMDALRVLDPQRLVWANMTGSGNETDAHLLADGRITIMWSSFAEKPLILRVYGRGRCVYAGDGEWDGFAALFAHLPEIRQIVVVAVESVQTSCGFGVPRMELIGQRSRLRQWAEGKGAEGLLAYQRKQNRTSIDGLPTALATRIEDRPPADGPASG